MQDLPLIDTSRLDRNDRVKLFKEVEKISEDVKKDKKVDFKGELFPIISAKDDASIKKEIKVNDRSILQRFKEFIKRELKIPDKKEIYYPFLGGFVSTLPSEQVHKTIEITRTPSMEEIQKIRLAQEKGSLKDITKSIISFAERRFRDIASPTISFAERRFRDIAGGVSSTIGDVKIQLAPTFIEEPLGIPRMRFGEVVRFGREEVLPSIGKYGERKTTQFFNWLYEDKGKETTQFTREEILPSIRERVPVYLHETMVYGGTSMDGKVKMETPTYIMIPDKISEEPVFWRKVIPKAVRYAPEVISYTIAPISMLGADIVTGSEKLRTLERDYKEEVKRQYDKYVEKGGDLTFKEFEKEVGSEIKRGMERGILWFDIGLPFMFLAGGAVKAGVSKITRPRISYVDLIAPEKGSVTIVGEPSAVVRGGGKQATIFKDALAIAERGDVGRKTIIKNWLGRTVYEGIPYGKKGSESYKEALKYLMKKGYSENQARNTLRLHRPSPTQEFFRGRVAVIGDEGGKQLIRLSGEEISKPLSMEIGGVKTRVGEKEVRFIDILGELKGVTKKGDRELFKFSEVIEKAFLTKEGRPFTKLTQAGKTTTRFEIATGVKKVGEMELLEKPIKTGIEGVEAFKYGTYDVYKDVSLLKQVVPKKRIMRLKGEPLDVVIKRDGDIFLEKFRKRLHKFEQAKFDKLTRESQLYWASQVEAGSRVVDMSRGKIRSLRNVKLSEIEDFGYSALAKRGLLKKKKPTDWVIGKPEKSIKFYVTPTEEAIKKLPISESIGLAKKGEPKLIIDLDEMFGIQKVRGFKGGKKQSSQQYLQQLFSVEEAQQKAISALKAKVTKPKITKPVKTTLEEPSKKVEMFPLVGARPVQVSKYYGKGVYERTEDMGIIVPRKGYQYEDFGLRTEDKSMQIFQQKPSVSTFQGERILLGLRQLPRQRQLQRPSSILRPEQAPRQIDIVKQAPREVSTPRQIIRSILKIKQKQRPTIKPRPIITPKPPKPPQKPTPRKPIIKPKPIFSLLEKEKEKKAKTTLDTFKVFVKKLGKDVELGEFETLGEAKKKLKKELLGTLRASGFITRRGKKQKIDLGFGFRPSKVEFGRVVQKKATRLLGKPEQKEAYFFRKKKGRSKFF